MQLAGKLVFPLIGVMCCHNVPNCAWMASHAACQVSSHRMHLGILYQLLSLALRTQVHARTLGRICV